MNKNEMGRVRSRYREIRDAYRVLMEKYERRSHMEDLGIDGRMVG
jgi:hypothetical protein